MNVPTMADLMTQGKQPEILFWVGSAGSYDDRVKKITRAFVKILHKANWQKAGMPAFPSMRSSKTSCLPSWPMIRNY